MNILVVAPHADDEVLGCGGVMAKYAHAGHYVSVAIMTDASVGAPEIFTPDMIETSRGEAKRAHQVLGVKETFFFDFPAPRLETAPSYIIANELSKLVKEQSIETIFLPHRGDIHKDHEVVFNAGLVAVRPINGCPVKNVYSYETLSETEWAVPFGNDVFIPTIYENISGFFDQKVEAMRCFRSQLKQFPHSRSIETLECLAKFRGSTVGHSHAEAFGLIRSIR